MILHKFWSAFVAQINKIANLFWEADPVAQMRYEYDRAVEVLNRAVALNPSDPDSYAGLGDALLAQRSLSLLIVTAGGHYVWTVKANQPDLKQDIAFLFQPEETVTGFSPATTDFRTAQTYDKGHGRTERRQLTVSAELKGYLDWPGAAQVFKLERWFTRGVLRFEQITTLLLAMVAVLGIAVVNNNSNY